MTWGLTGDEHSHRFGAAIHRLMLLAWGDFESFPRLKNKVVMLDLEGEFSFQHEEELTRVDVGVTGLAGAGWHELFDDAELRRFDEMPTVAVGSLGPSPFVVLGGFCADDLCWHGVRLEYKKTAF
jgi:hypothetical protein